MIVLGDNRIPRDLLLRQIRSFYPLSLDETDAIDEFIDEALERIERCFSRVRNKYYHQNDAVLFDPLHGCQWAAFLYFISNSIYRGGESRTICDKIYGVSKALSGADLFYQVDLPEIFTFDHPLGAVVGRGVFSDYFSFSQGCTIGNNHGVYPTFGQSVFMMSDSKVIGDCSIGDNVLISANTYIKDTDIPGGSLVFGQSPDLVIKTERFETVREHAETVFRYE